MKDLDRNHQSTGLCNTLLSETEAKDLIRKTPEWILRDKSIERDFRFKDFRQAMGFVNKVAESAERHDHHPDIFISYNKIHLTLSTHKIGGLSRKDFALAEEIESLMNRV